MKMTGLLNRPSNWLLFLKNIQAFILAGQLTDHASSCGYKLCFCTYYRCCNNLLHSLVTVIHYSDMKTVISVRSSKAEQNWDWTHNADLVHKQFIVTQKGSTRNKTRPMRIQGKGAGCWRRQSWVRQDWEQTNGRAGGGRHKQENQCKRCWS